jgi:hypothetical protein
MFEICVGVVVVVVMLLAGCMLYAKMHDAVRRDRVIGHLMTEEDRNV